MSKLLLLKLKNDQYYIRKNSWRFIEVDLFIIIDKNNQVIGYTFFDRHHDNNIEFIASDVKDKDTRGLIGETKLKQMKPTDYYFKYNINDYIKLSAPIKLDKKVNGLRYATLEEETLIKNCIVKDLIQSYNITFKDKLYNTPKYSRLYEYCMRYKLDDGLFNVL